MSLRAFSNLAVQDITDESAAIHGGGVGFQGFDGLSGTGAASPVVSFDDNAPVGILGSFRLNNLPGGPTPNFADNKLESFRATGILSGRTYRASFFDGDNFQTFLGSFTLASAANGLAQNLATTLRNRTSSVRIERIA